jgi:outer membrane protein OmpA-like peptidoglycan-associated protein
VEGDGPDSSHANEFRIRDSGTSARNAHGVNPSQIRPTESEAAVKLFVVDAEEGPIPGIVVSLIDPDGRTHYADPTDAAGYTEVLLPVGKAYEMVYLSLGRRDVAARVHVPNEPNLNLRLTLRYTRWLRPAQPQPAAQTPPDSPRFVLGGVEFDTGTATLRESSHERLETVVEYMTARASTRIEISGHTDNVGNPNTNMALSERRAETVREYLISRGVDGSRIEAVGYGDTLPIAPNASDEGRQRNRRIEATEL